VSDDRNNVIIDAGGALTVDAGAQKRLVAHAGRYRVVPTTGDLVILQRTTAPHEGGSSSTLITGRVAIAGEIDAVGGLVDVINFIHHNRWSGQLAVVHESIRKTLYFRRGDVRTAASNIPEDRLGAILYRYGMISEETLAAALKIAGPSRLGHTLVEQGALNPHDLYTYVRRQVEEIFFSVIVFRRGSFYFYRTGDDDGPTSQLMLSTKSLLFDGVRRIDELSYFREKLPSGDVVLVRREPQPNERLPPREMRVLSLVDGKRDIATLSRLTHLGEFETTKTLYQLLQSGYVQQRASKSPLEVSPATAPATVGETYARIVDTFNDVYAKIHAAVSAKGKEAALAKGLESFFGSVAEFAPLFVAVTLGTDGTLPREQVLANLEFAPTDNKLDYLYRGLNELLFFELFTAGEAVDRREEIELHQRLNQILQEVHASTDDLDPEISVVDEHGAA
jgi:hypothetical protein